MSERRSFSDKTPWQIACEWYGENDIARSISEKRWHNEIPRDVNSRAFAAWLTDQYRLAMAKGVQLGRGDTRCIGRPERLALCDEVERLRNLLREEWQRHEMACMVATTKESRDYHMAQSQRIRHALTGGET